MKAIRIHNYGGVDQLLYEDAPVPRPGSRELLVKMIAVSINPVDLKMRTGEAKERFPVTFPGILGRDVSGEVVELGADVTEFKIGQKVMGLVTGSYAEYVLCKTTELALIPNGLDPVEAAALPLVITTGAQVIELGVKPTNGQTVLITGAMGSVGRVAVYVAKQHGAQVTAGVRASQREEASGLGADSIVSLDSDEEIAGLSELDGVADMVGHDVIGKIIPHIRKGGVLASVLGIPDAAQGHDLRLEGVVAHPDSQRLEDLALEVDAGNLVIPIGKRYTLARMREAHELAEKGSAGKIIVTP